MKLKTSAWRLVGTVLSQIQILVTKNAYMLAGAIGFVLVFFLIHLPHGPEHWSADLRTALLSERLGSQNKKITLVEVTNKTLKRYPYITPIDRKLLADLIRTIDAAQPEAIGLDFIFDRATDTDKDDYLRKTITGVRTRIVLGALDDESLTDSEREFQSDFLTNCLVGHLYLGEQHANPLIISEHVIRLIAEQSNTPQGKRPSFAEILAGLDGPHDAVDKSRQIAWLLPPKDHTETFLTLPAELVLDHDRIGLPMDQLFHNRFVLIGGNFPDRDQHLTPLSVWSEARFSGLFIHAQILAQLLRDKHVYGIHHWYLYWPCLAIIAILGFWIGRRDRSGHFELIIELVSVVALIVISIIAFRYGNFIIQALVPSVGTLSDLEIDFSLDRGAVSASVVTCVGQTRLFLKNKPEVRNSHGHEPNRQGRNSSMSECASTHGRPRRQRGCDVRPLGWGRRYNHGRCWRRLRSGLSLLGVLVL